MNYALTLLNNVITAMASFLDDPEERTLGQLIGPITLGFRGGPNSLAHGNNTSYVFDDLDKGGWKVGTLDIANGVNLKNIVRETSNGPFTVLEDLDFKVNIKDANIANGSTVHLPLTPNHMMGHALPQIVPVPESRNHPHHRLATSVEKSIVLLYGYLLQADGTLQPIAETDATNVDFVPNVFADALTNQSATTTVVLVHVEIALCEPKADFEPFGAADAARGYPRLSVWSQKEVDEINCDIGFKRPKKTTLHHAHGDKSIYMSVYTDRNLIDDDKELTPFTVLQPYWPKIFDNYRIDIQGAAAITCITNNQTPRIRDDIRKVRASDTDFTLNFFESPGFNGITDGFDFVSFFPYTDIEDEPDVFTSLRKFPFQGQFDNVHLAPAMNLNGEAVHMAPLCEHDCFHMHWRWSNGFKNIESKGWSSGWPESGGPNETPGRPLTQPKQTVDILPAPTGESPGFIYRAQAKRADFDVSLRPSKRWRTFCHHGFGYITGLSVKGFGGVKLLDLLEGIGSNRFYHRIRFGEKSDGSFVPLIVEEQFPLIENL